MKMELMRLYTWEEFKKEFYKQHPDGDTNYLYYCWNMYQANKCSDAKRWRDD